QVGNQQPVRTATAETEAADASETTVEATAVAAADTGESAPESDAATDEALEEEEEDVEVSVASLLATQEYNTTVVKSIYSSIIYPKAAVRRNRQGTVRVDMLISRAGELIDAQVVESAGFGPLDEAAIAAVKKAAPFPAAPDEIPDDEIQLLLPVSFRLQ
ncbi:MAG: energy transducer TonB, partial [bacterium]